MVQADLYHFVLYKMQPPILSGQTVFRFWPWDAAANKQLIPLRDFALITPPASIILAFYVLAI